MNQHNTVMFIYLKMRKPSAIPNARTHIPISNGGQLQIRERKSSAWLPDSMACSPQGKTR